MAEDKNTHRWVLRGDRIVYLAPGADEPVGVVPARPAQAVEEERPVEEPQSSKQATHGAHTRVDVPESEKSED